MQCSEFLHSSGSRVKSGSKSGKGSVLMSVLIPAKNGDGGAIGRRRLLAGTVMGAGRLLCVIVVVDAAEVNACMVNRGMIVIGVAIS